ncbi:hypothetical protein [Pseudoalteromonas galatheae]|uniref:hypothetical protein n=1 Tax=Pseudoalteromonas galatheae TaxID=579562 RepID=UPI001109F690|nr:hypothetical protein [Pseudoalteromonas galatheae]NKC20974.1 hypothetical protein [Pseudoalteromonas galatheae]
MALIKPLTKAHRKAELRWHLEADSDLLPKSGTSKKRTRTMHLLLYKHRYYQTLTSLLENIVLNSDNKE